MTDKATSPYLNQEARELADVVQLRESNDLGIPSDSPFHPVCSPSAPTICTNKRCVGYGTEYPEGERICDWCGRPTVPVSHLAEPYEYEAFDHLYQPSRYVGTVCEPGPTFYQQKMAQRWRMFRNIAVMATGAGFIALSLWAAAHQFGAQPDREIMAQTHGFSGGER